MITHSAAAAASAAAPAPASAAASAAGPPSTREPSLSTVVAERDTEKLAGADADRVEIAIDGPSQPVAPGVGARGPHEKGAAISIAEAADGVDDVFVKKEGGPDYRAVSWIGALVLLLKTQIGLGVLALPNALMTLGLVPGLIVLLGLGFITTYSDYILGQFRTQFPGIHSVGDVGFVMFGVIGREIIGWSYFLFMVFLTSSGVLATSIALNAITEHATCTVVWAVVAAIIIGFGASARTFKQISWLGWLGISFLLPAVFIVVIACGVSDRPPAAPPGLPFDKKLRAFNNPSFTDAMVAVVNILFAYCGTPGFFSVIAEMKNPRHYNRAMFACQAFSIAFYTTVAVVLWYYCGRYVASPALGSAGPLIKKIAYGIALPGLIAGPVVYSHLAIKFCFVRLLRGTVHLQESTKTHWVAWISIVTGVVSLAFIIAQVIPFFDQLIGLIGALFAGFFCLTLCGGMWIFANDYRRKEGRTTLGFKFNYALAVFMILAGLFILVGGFYASVVSIKDAFETGEVGSPFSCADNSGSTVVQA